LIECLRKQWVLLQMDKPAVASSNHLLESSPLQNLLDPAILFFIFGVFAGAIRSNLEIPEAIAKFLSLYLLMALGLKGGFALAQSGLTLDVALALLSAVVMAIVVPLLAYVTLHRFIDGFNAAAMAASYGSVSAVTFLTAMQYLEQQDIVFGGHMAVAMVLMESPAILFAIVIANRLRQNEDSASQTGSEPGSQTGHAPALLKQTSIAGIIHESLTNGAHLLLLGAMVVGLLSGDKGMAVMQPFSSDLFKGMLSFFLLDMGLIVARSFRDALNASPCLLAYAVIAPPIHAALALALGHTLQLALADKVLLMVLSASASYIVVPAVLRHAIPEARPVYYLGLSLGITFPLNILLGIPFYTFIAKTFEALL
jgi:hypothetical protein